MEPSTESAVPSPNAGDGQTVTSEATQQEADWTALEGLLEKVSPDELIDRALSKKPLKVKINQKDREIKSLADLKLRGGEEVTSYERFNEAKKLYEEGQALQNALKSGGIDTFMKLKGIDPTDASQVDAFLTQELDRIEAEAKKTPDQRELECFRAEKAAIEAEQAKREAEEKTAKEQEENARFATQVFKEIDDQLSASGIPLDPYLRQRVVDTMILAGEEKGVFLSPSEAMVIALDEEFGRFEPVFQKLPVEMRMKYLGEDVRRALLDEAAGKAKAAGNPFTKPKAVDQGQAQESKPAVKVVSTKNAWTNQFNILKPKG